MDRPAHDPESNRPWLEIEELAHDGAWQTVRQRLEEMPEEDRFYVVSHLDTDVLADLLETLRREDAADLLDWLPDVQAASALDEVDPHAAAEILDQLPSDEQVDLLARMDGSEAVLADLPHESAEQVRELLRHDPESAGGLMASEVFTVEEGIDVYSVVEKIRQHPTFSTFPIQYIYVVSNAGVLRGLVQLRSLIISQPRQPVSELMIADPVSVTADASLDDLEALFDRYAFLGAPVVDGDGHLLGVVHRSAVEEAISESAQSDHMKSLGLAREELRSMPVWFRSRRRLSWLSVNIVLNMIAASVIAAYQETLEAAIALAIFLPMISDMSGCSGNQAVAVSMRELSLGILRPNEVLRVWSQEILLGLVNGLALGALIGAVAYLWQDNVALGFVVGGALAVNTMVAVSIGGVIPLLLRRAGQDPALASGPVLTTITDMCGFFLALSFATVALDQL